MIHPVALRYRQNSDKEFTVWGFAPFLSNVLWLRRMFLKEIALYNFLPRYGLNFLFFIHYICLVYHTVNI